jgi:histidinol-phosphate aminotransferase
MALLRRVNLRSSKSHLIREIMSINSFIFGPEYVRSLKPYVAGKPISAVAREFGFDENKIVKLASNENPRGMPVGARVAVEAVIRHGPAAYPDPDAYELKTILEQTIHIPRTWITVGNGSNDLLEMSARAFVERGQSVVVSQYAFSAYLLAIAGVGARPIIVPATDFGHDLDAMLHAIEPDTRLIYIANPNNPTGTFCLPEQMRSFLQRVPKNIIVVLDEAYAEYLPDEQQSDVASLVAQHRNLVIVRTFSKAYALASLRIGFAVAQEHLSDLLNRVRQPFNTSVFAQAAATAAIADREFVDRSRSENVTGRKQLYAGFEAIGLPYLRSAGNFVLVGVGDGAKVFTALLEAGIIVRPVLNYGLPEWLRVSVGLRDQNERFLETLTSITANDSLVEHKSRGAAVCRN